MIRGYRQNIVEANRSADSDNLGVILGQVCISRKYPVIKVSKELEVSRQGVYDWFLGRSKPSVEKEDRILLLIKRLTSK